MIMILIKKTLSLTEMPAELALPKPFFSDGIATILKVTS
jgi:hypothetical protein